MHYAGARFYMSALGRWGTADPLADKYPGHSPYNYVVNNPVNAVDPDGRLVIFVNGHRAGDNLIETLFNAGDCCVKYWGGNNMTGFAGQVMNRFEGESAMFFDGSVGGGGANVRREVGRMMANNEFGTILDAVSKEGEITETIKVFSHSKGTAYATGLISGILSEAARHGVDDLQIEFHAAIEAYQASQLSVDPRVATFQISDFTSLFLGKQKLSGARNIPASLATALDLTGNPGHSLSNYSPNRIINEIGRSLGTSYEMSNWLMKMDRAGVPIHVIE